MATLSNVVPESVLAHLRIVTGLKLPEGSLSLIERAGELEVVASRCMKCGCSVPYGQILDQGCFGFLIDTEGAFEKVSKTFHSILDRVMERNKRLTLADLEILHELKAVGSPHSPRSQTSSPKGRSPLPPRPSTSHRTKRRELFPSTSAPELT